MSVLPNYLNAANKTELTDDSFAVQPPATGNTVACLGRSDSIDGVPSDSIRHSEAGADPSVFYRWLDHHQPDVVFTLYNQVLHWLEDRPMRIPEDIGLIQLEWGAASPDIAGMHQHNDVAGEAAVDMVISQIHNNESGIPDFPRATLIGATWKHGKTVLDNHDNGERRTEVVVRSAPTSNDRSGGAER